MTAPCGDPGPGETAARALAPLPWGSFRGRSLGRDWLVTRTRFARGASEKIVARALDAEGYVSANLYHLESGPRLRPCEMPAAHVLRFLADLSIL